MKQKMNNLTTILLFLILIAGLSLLLYPSVSDYWNSFHSSRAITTYAEDVAGMDEEQYAEIWSAAWEYNQSLLSRNTDFSLSDSQKNEYEQLLDASGIGVMGYIEIPEISVSLPIYHGTSDSILQVAVGHLEWSSLPVGGESSHCVLSGHRGLPSAKLFTDLDKIREGDIFLLRVLDEVLTYEVDKITIVEPSQVSDLQIVEGEDLCTLVTCTPYGVNTHRVLVRGVRTKYIPEEQAKAKEVKQAPFEKCFYFLGYKIPYWVAGLFIVGFVLVVAIIVIVIVRKNNKRAKTKKVQTDEK